MKIQGQTHKYNGFPDRANVTEESSEGTNLLECTNCIKQMLENLTIALDFYSGWISTLFTLLTQASNGWCFCIGRHWIRNRYSDHCLPDLDVGWVKAGGQKNELHCSSWKASPGHGHLDRAAQAFSSYAQNVAITNLVPMQRKHISCPKTSSWSFMISCWLSDSLPCASYNSLRVEFVWQFIDRTVVLAKIEWFLHKICSQFLSRASKHWKC